MAITPFGETQDFHDFATAYNRLYPDDVLTINEALSADQDLTALVDTLAIQGRHPMLVCQQVGALGVPVVTNVFASRTRIARLFGVEPAQLHATFQARANSPIAPRYVDQGPIQDEVSKAKQWMQRYYPCSSISTLTADRM